MKKYFLIAFCILNVLAIPSAQSQVPGYMGKRCIVKANISGMPLTGLLYSGEKAFDINARYSIGIDYVLSRNICFGISAEQVNDVIKIDKLTTTPTGQSYAPYPDVFKSAANFYGYNLGVNMKFFLLRSSGSLAPLGRYFLLEYLRSNITVSDDGRYYPSGKTELNTIHTNTFLIGMGSQKILFNRLVIDTNLKYGINFYGLARLQNAETREKYEPIYSASTSKMFSDYLFTLTVGIGILAF
jgi:hypothetical protein